MVNQSTIIFGFTGTVLLLILAYAFRRYLRNNRVLRRTEFAPHTEFVAAIGPDITTNNRSARLQYHYSYTDTTRLTRVSQVQPDTININSQMERSHDWALREQEANFRPPVFHIALDMPAPTLTTEEEAPPKYDELNFQ